MSRAREDSVKAALAEFDPEKGLGPQDVLYNAADAVSDLWEPMLRATYEALVNVYSYADTKRLPTTIEEQAKSAMTRAKEALK